MSRQQQNASESSIPEATDEKRLDIDTSGADTRATSLIIENTATSSNPKADQSDVNIASGTANPETNENPHHKATSETHAEIIERLTLENQRLNAELKSQKRASDAQIDLITERKIARHEEESLQQLNKQIASLLKTIETSEDAYKEALDKYTSEKEALKIQLDKIIPALPYFWKYVFFSKPEISRAFSENDRKLIESLQELHVITDDSYISIVFKLVENEFCAGGVFKKDGYNGVYNNQYNVFKWKKEVSDDDTFMKWIDESDSLHWITDLIVKELFPRAPHMYVGSFSNFNGGVRNYKPIYGRDHH